MIALAFRGRKCRSLACFWRAIPCLWMSGMGCLRPRQGPWLHFWSTSKVSNNNNRLYAANPLHLGAFPRQDRGVGDGQIAQGEGVGKHLLHALGAGGLGVERGAADVFLDDACLLFVGVVEEAVFR